MISGIGFS